MREVELKAVVADLAAARARLTSAGATRVFAGRLEDRRYDSADRRLAGRDHVLRLRVYRGEQHGHDARVLLDGGRATRVLLDWKGPTRLESGYKVREELSVGADDPATLALLLERLGYLVTREIDREIDQYALGEATVRFECYPRMDVLAEVEGTPAAIEAAIVALGIPRAAFTAERLPAFVARFEARTRQRAALCDRELAGDFRFRADDA